MTGLLRAWGGGDLAARDQLVVVVQQELRCRAAARLRRERPGHVYAVASEMMRRILVDHARRRKMAKRSGGLARVTLGEAVAQQDPRSPARERCRRAIVAIEETRGDLVLFERE